MQTIFGGNNALQCNIVLSGKFTLVTGDAEVELLPDDLWLFSGFFCYYYIWLILAKSGSSWLIMANHGNPG